MSGELVIRLPAEADRRLTEAAKRLALGRRQLARALLLAVLDAGERDTEPERQGRDA
jgi:hypothetical protein